MQRGPVYRCALIEPKGPNMLQRYLPILSWLPGYSRADLTNDAIAAAVVTIMLIPQGMAYAMLAGLPPQAGLYGAILPLLLYAVFGTSRPLAVGPVAVVALMTAASAGAIAQAGSAEFHYAALWLALISGALMLAMGLFRLGFIANFLSHPVISGFITAAGILIAASQLRHLLGAPIGGKTLPQVIPSIVANLGNINPATVIVSAALLAFSVLGAQRGRAAAGTVRACPGERQTAGENSPSGGGGRLYPAGMGVGVGTLRHCHSGRYSARLARIRPAADGSGIDPAFAGACGHDRHRGLC